MDGWWFSVKSACPFCFLEGSFGKEFSWISLCNFTANIIFLFCFFSKVAGKSKFSRHPENMSSFWTLKVKFRCYLRKNIRYLALESLLLVKRDSKTRDFKNIYLKFFFFFLGNHNSPSMIDRYIS